jgi:hypothetical protein
MFVLQHYAIKAAKSHLLGLREKVPTDWEYVWVLITL